MTTKQFLLSTIILGSTSSMTCAMQTCEPTIKCEITIKTEESYQERVAMLKNEGLRRFVKDYATWSKEEQNKLSASRDAKSKTIQYCVTSKPLADHKYNGHVGQYIQSHLTDQDSTSLFAIINYLKNKK